MCIDTFMHTCIYFYVVWATVPTQDTDTCTETFICRIETWENKWLKKNEIKLVMQCSEGYSIQLQNYGSSALKNEFMYKWTVTITYLVRRVMWVDIAGKGYGAGCYVLLSATWRDWHLCCTWQWLWAEGRNVSFQVSVCHHRLLYFCLSSTSVCLSACLSICLSLRRITVLKMFTTL